MSKPNLIIIVEGQTEEYALPALLREHLCNFGLMAKCQILDKRGKQPGGITVPFDRLVRDVKETAKKYKGAYISTCFDYYRLNSKWPKVADIKNEEIDVTLKASKIEAALLKVVTAEIGMDILWDGHFIPHIQLHEFETLLFAAPEVLGQGLVPIAHSDDLKTHFTEIVTAHDSQCEKINDSIDTAPSKRLEEKSNYKKGKTGHARVLLPQIGLARIRTACPHFNNWIERLESIYA